MNPQHGAPFQPLPLGAIWPTGWMRAQMRRDLTDGFAGCLDALTERAATDLFSHRIKSSAQQFTWWDSETRGNWLWGYVMMAFLTDLPEHQARAAALMDALKQTQDDSGYIGIYSPASRYQHGDSENGELWGQGRALLAMLTELLFSLTSALQKSGAAACGDWIETLAFNAGQGARLPDGSAISYLSLDTRLAATCHRPDTYSNLQGKPGRFKYSPTHEDVACCNPNAVRFLPHYVSRMWMRSAESPGLAAVTYGPCTLTTDVDGVRVTITEETDFPFSDNIRFAVTPERPVHFTLRLRRPAWAKAMDVPGVATSPEAGYVVIDKTWSAGDTVAVTFTAGVRVSAYSTGGYSVSRGALQYVLPIAPTLRPIKDYPLSRFHDFEATPQDLEQAYTPIFLDECQPDYGLVFEQQPLFDMDRGWEQSPVHLKAGAARLTPMGCTVLRRAAFPLKRA
jgi:hypothetical protein